MLGVATTMLRNLMMHFGAAWMEGAGRRRKSFEMQQVRTQHNAS